MVREKILQQIQNAKPTEYKPPPSLDDRPPLHLVPRHLSQRVQQLHHQPH
jgi:hypothetical protein